jgi:hypothetical protein
MTIGTLPKVDGDLFYLPEPMGDDDILTTIFFYSDKVKFVTMAELGDEGLLLHWDGMRIPFQPDWNMCVVISPEVPETIQ